jgi:secernin
MCDTVVRVEAGRVLFAKNSDRDPNEAQLLEWHPAADHPDGATVRCTYLEIPQVARTHAVLISRPFWMWGAEMGTNEHGLTIGNEAVFTREPYAKTGLTGMDLLRLVLERATDTAEAVKVLVDLLEAHGQGGGCGHEDRSFTYHNSFLIADVHGAVVLETAGRRWVSEEVTRGPRSISNGLTIQPFATRYGDRLRTRVSACRIRRHSTETAAAKAETPADLATILRDHGAGDAPSYSPINGAMAAPCMHAGGLLAASQTTASWISELSPDSQRHWATATAAPCTSLFKPVRIDTPLDLGPAPTDRFDDATLWWRHERLHRATMRDPQRLLPRYTPERDEVERTWFEQPAEPAVAFDDADRLAARWYDEVAGSSADVRPRYVRRYWRLRDQRAGLAADGGATHGTDPHTGAARGTAR